MITNHRTVPKNLDHLLLMLDPGEGMVVTEFRSVAGEDSVTVPTGDSMIGYDSTPVEYLHAQR